jgi:hypothetical protein
MQRRDEGDDKARALRSQINLCHCLADEEDIGDPELAVKLRDFAQKLEAQVPLQNAA